MRRHDQDAAADDNRFLDWNVSMTGDTISNRLNLAGQFDNTIESKILKLLSSEIFLNNQLWQFSDNNQLTFTSDKVESKNL